MFALLQWPLGSVRDRIDVPHTPTVMTCQANRVGISNRQEANETYTYRIRSVWSLANIFPRARRVHDEAIASTS
jgi:hypothetical protein